MMIERAPEKLVADPVSETQAAMAAYLTEVKVLREENAKLKASVSMFTQRANSDANEISRLKYELDTVKGKMHGLIDSVNNLVGKL